MDGQFEIVLVAIGLCGTAGIQGRKIPPGRKALDFSRHGSDRSRADERTCQEGRFYVDPVDPVIGMGLDEDVSYVMPTHFILEHEILDKDVADDIFLADRHVVGVDLATQAGDAPLVEMQGVQVSIADVCVELVETVLSLVRKGEYSLEQEVEVRV